jgi:hypothetical protein
MAITETDSRTEARHANRAAAASAQTVVDSQFGPDVREPSLRRRTAHHPKANPGLAGVDRPFAHRPL